jgi:3-dehydroquinate synthetase
MAVDMSYRLGWIDDMLVKRVLNILQQAKLPTAPPDTITVEMFKSVMAVRELNVTVRTSSIWFLSSLKCLYSYPLAGR